MISIEKLKSAGALLALMFVLFLCGAQPASAATVNLKLKDTSDSVVYNGVYAGMYTLENMDTGNEFLAWCIDGGTTVNIGDQWRADVYNKSDVDFGASVKFSGLDQQTRYSQVGWLYSEALSATPHDRARMQVAAWNVMNYGVMSMDTDAQNYYNAATSGTYDSFDWSSVARVLTPNPLDVSQEYLAPVPIPGALWLFASGAGILLTRMRKA